MADGVGPLLIGVPDTEISEKDDKLCSWDTNKFGGRPNWMTRSPDVYPTCIECGKMLLLVAQIYCPLYNSIYHRTLYIFGCANLLCWNKSKSWLVLRCQSITSSDKQDTVNKSDETQNSVDDWCDDAGDWGDVEVCSDPPMDELQYEASRITLHSTEHPIKEENTTSVLNNCDLVLQQYSSDVPYFTAYYISVIENAVIQNNSKNTDLTAHERHLVSQYEHFEGKDLQQILESSAHSKDQNGENYEKTSDDFHKFLNCLQSYPQQCIRYQWNGTPLMISKSFEQSDLSSTIPPCQYCGAKRDFELQLMPALVCLLKGKGTSSDVPIVTCNEDKRIIKDNTGCQMPGNTTVTECKDTLSDISVGTDYNEVNATKFCTMVNENMVSGKNVCSQTLQETGIEFGTVLVLTCSQSCWDDTSSLPREEFVLVQAEPDIELFSTLKSC